MRGRYLLALVVAAGCASGGSGNDDSDKDVISNQVGDWDATLATVNASGVTGTARAQSVGVGTGVRVSIQGAAANGHHPWHVHRGRCGDMGAIVGEANDYPTLHVGTDGRASANATIGVPLRENDSYYVNVHRSPADLGTIIACGNLSND